MSKKNGRRRLTSAKRSKSARRRGKQEYFTLKDIKRALWEGYGNLAKTSRILSRRFGKGCGRSQLVRNYLDKYPELEKYRETAHARLMDQVDSNFIDAIKNPGSPDHMRATTFVAGNAAYQEDLARGSRSYAKRLEHTGPGGGPIKTQGTPLDFSQLSDSELELLEELFVKSGVRDESNRGTQETDARLGKPRSKSNPKKSSKRKM